MTELQQDLEASVGRRAHAGMHQPARRRLRHRSFYGRVWRPTLAELALPAVGVHVLRHSAAFTLTVYGHMFDTDLDELAERLEAFTTRDERGDGFCSRRTVGRTARGLTCVDAVGPAGIEPATEGL
jgi:hypothetical protein